LRLGEDRLDFLGKERKALPPFALPVRRFEPVELLAQLARRRLPLSKLPLVLALLSGRCQGDVTVNQRREERLQADSRSSGPEGPAL
jgi:hypothetical protein